MLLRSPCIVATEARNSLKVERFDAMEFDIVGLRVRISYARDQIIVNGHTEVFVGLATLVLVMTSLFYFLPQARRCVHQDNCNSSLGFHIILFAEITVSLLSH